MRKYGFFNDLLDADRMEYAWTESNIVTEFGTASTVVMKKIANLPIRKFLKLQSFVDLDDTEITYYYF